MRNILEKSDFATRIEALGRRLKADGYSFCTPTPSTHTRVVGRNRPGADILCDVFGWNKAVAPSELPERYQEVLQDRDFFDVEDGYVRARLRYSSLGPLLLAHSGFPTREADAVFFGPDTYRFAYAIQAFHDRNPGFSPGSCVDIGAGSGAGGLFCATLYPRLSEIALLDINPRALAFAAANSALNGIPAIPRCSDILSAWLQPADLIICNPPYLVDPALRAYRHGGGDWGADLALRALRQALNQLSPMGHLLLYTGSPIVDGQDKFLEAAQPLLEQGTLKYRYEEIDPDVFGEELDNWPYDQADRIATVMLHVKGSDLRR
ncbi:MAG TPA: methyltransferase [Rhizomicrobium sp.]|nr:methyltransferase [Rhizomicrobium sp.]